MASIDAIQQLLKTENRKLKEELSKDIMQQVGNLIDKRLEAHEEKVMGELRALQARTEALEKGRSAVVLSSAGPAAAKRARSEPRPGPQKHELKPLVVLTGFPFNSRKKDVEAFVTAQLAGHEEWEHLTPFAPAVRTSVGMIKMRSKEEVFDFIQFWKELDITFKDFKIRARADKTPEQRKANSKIYKMSEFLKGLFQDKDVDPDFRYSSVWVGDGEVVKYDPQADKYIWEEEGIQKAGVTIDRDAAEQGAAQL